MKYPLEVPLETHPHTNLDCSTAVLSELRLARQTISIAQQQRHQREGMITLVGDARHPVPLICQNGPLLSTKLQTSSAPTGLLQNMYHHEVKGRLFIESETRRDNFLLLLYHSQELRN